MACDCAVNDTKSDRASGILGSTASTSSERSINLALIFGALIVALVALGIGVYAFRGQQKGEALTEIGMAAAKGGGGVYPFPGLQAHSSVSSPYSSQSPSPGW